MPTARKDKYGPLTVPIVTTVATGGTLATLCDPGVTNLLTAFKNIVNEKLTTAWAAAGSAFSSVPVAASYPYEPIPALALRTWRWPALFMWRRKERLFNRTQQLRCAESEGSLLYVLPPLPYEHAIRLEPFRVAVRTVLDAFIDQHGDPTYSSGAGPLYTNALESFEFVQCEYGYLPATSELSQAHPMLDMQWRMRERQDLLESNGVTLQYIVTTYELREETGTAATTSFIEQWFPQPGDPPSGATSVSAFTPGFSDGFF